LGGITIGRTDGRSRWDAGANWLINTVYNRVGVLKIETAWACC